MNIEESIKILDKFITEHKLFNIKHSDGLEEAIETLLTAYEKEKRLAEANLKDSEEFKDNMCNHRCILNSKIEELETELEKEKEKNKNAIKYIKEISPLEVGRAPNGKMMYDHNLNQDEIYGLLEILEEE